MTLCFGESCQCRSDCSSRLRTEYAFAGSATKHPRPEFNFICRRAWGKGVNTPCLIAKHSVMPMPRQCFAKRPKINDLDAFCSAIPKRTFNISEITFSFVLCGEITGFNREGTLKHGRKASLGIVINPAYTPMGRWHVLDEKFKALSHHSLAVHVTNNTRNNPTAATTDVRIYRHGCFIQNRKFNDHAAWCVCEI